MFNNKDNASMDLAIAMDAAKAVSFDFFDTLFVRSVLDPREVFDLLGEQFKIASFRGIREQAQNEAFRRMAETGRKEISLDDIYACMPGLLPLDIQVEDLRDAEYQLELAVTMPNPALRDLYVHAVANKPVVIVSDMYLPCRFFDELLERHGLPRVPLFISSECNATKRDRGELFDLVSNKLGMPPSHILHIGDNPVSDVERAIEHGFEAFHYVNPHATDAVANLPLGVSIARSMVKLVPAAGADTFYGLGFRYGGAAALGFLGWIAERASKDGIDFLLFISRDGFILERMASDGVVEGLPPFAYFPGSRIAFGLAAMDAGNFEERLDFLLAGSHGLAPVEVLERIGVPAPSEQVMQELGLADDVTVNDASMSRMRDLLLACRAEILKVCLRNRRGLFNLVNGLGIRPGSRVAMVDTGWSGTTLETLQRALAKLFSVDLTGYYLCLTDAPECQARRATLNLHAMFDSASGGEAVVRRLYEQRTNVELFFSAPHHAVIGYETGADGTVTAVEDPGRGHDPRTVQHVLEIQRGMLEFERHFRRACRTIGYRARPTEVASQLFALLDAFDRGEAPALNEVRNFDAWGSSRRLVLRADTYSAGVRSPA